MAANIREILPFIVNSLTVLVILFLLLRKPLRRFVYQRHERLKDFVEDSARAHASAAERHRLSEGRLRASDKESETLIGNEVVLAKKEATDALRRGAEEVARTRADTDRLIAAMSADVGDRVRGEFLDQVVEQAEKRLRDGLERDDHGAIFKRAQTSIEVSA